MFISPLLLNWIYILIELWSKIKHFVQNIHVLISDFFQSWKIKAGEVVPCLKNQCEYANMNIPYTRHALMMVTKQTRTPPKHNYTDTHSCIYSNMLTIRHNHMHMEPAHLWPTFIWCCLRGYLWGEVSRDWGFSFPLSDSLNCQVPLFPAKHPV